MKRIQLLMSLAVFAAILPLSRAGDISGTVTLKGTPPPELDIASAESGCQLRKVSSHHAKTHFTSLGPTAASPT